jgi:hypothetical protein
MIARVSERLAGWHICSEKVYQEAYQEFGGSFCTHPDVVRFLADKYSLDIRYKCRYVKGVVVSACFDDGTSLSLAPKTCPVVFDDIWFPSRDGIRFMLLKHSKRLSPFNRSNIINGIYSDKLKHKICYIKKSFSNSTVKKRNGELRAFIRDGGSIRDISEFSNDELAFFYIKMFKNRWGEKYACYSYAELTDVIQALRPFVFGSVLFFRDEVCAYDLIYHVQNKHHIYFEDLNGGFDSKISEFALGSILLWVNILQADLICKNHNKERVFSIGIFAGWEYKRQWCKLHPLGRSLCF